MDMYKDILKFIDACDQTTSDEAIKLYQRLIEEEYTEFTLAVHQENDVEQLDACIDMIWVILGYCKMKGYDVDGAWEEVSNTNFAKINAETGKVNRRHDGKILKPEGWKPPDLKPFV